MKSFDEHNLRPSQARTFLRRLRLDGRTVYIAVGQRPRLAGKDGLPSDNLATVRGCVPVPRSVAVEFIQEAYGDPPSGGPDDLLVRIAVGESVVMVGRA